jgi:adenylate cyclase
VSLPVKDIPLTESGPRASNSEILLGVAKRVNAFETIDEILECLVDITTATLDAERSTIFLYDRETEELYSHVAQGNLRRKIRLFANRGVSGHVFTTGAGVMVNDVTADERFYSAVDRETGFVTRNILCAPIKTFTGETIGVVEVLNKKSGPFTDDDMGLLKEISLQASVALKSSQIVARMNEERRRELEFLDVVVDITGDFDINVILEKVINEVTRMLNAERATILLNDEKRSELWCKSGHGLDSTEIRFPNNLGIAGTVFTTGETVNIPYAYADMRFNPRFDRETGFFTHTVLCCPIVNKEGKVIGVTQVLNKRGGRFTEEDEARLKAFTAHVSIALENAKLFEEIANMKNYNESMLHSLSNCVITIDDQGVMVTCNNAGLKITGLGMDEITGKRVDELFGGENRWVLEKLARLEVNMTPEYSANRELVFGPNKKSVNLTVLPLLSADKRKLGSMVVIEDISAEKRIKSTMSRYMDPALADRLLEENHDMLGGRSVPATILFSDIRGFTSLTEELGAEGMVRFLNEYFTIMVDCIQREGGMLDKFIGDAIMATFGIPLKTDDDEDRAVRAAISMIRELLKWNAERVARGEKPIDMGIGLNSDVVISGNIGTPKRMDYTVIGDGVNVAARLESACKEYNARILVAENTFRKLRGTYRARNVDDVVVKGKAAPVGIYEILDFHTDETFPNIMDAIGFFTEARRHYKARDWKQAIKFFEKALICNQGDELSLKYIDRCDYFRANPPAEDWGGVFVMKSK